MSQAQLESMADELMAQADATYIPGTTIDSQVMGTQAAPQHESSLQLRCDQHG